MSAVVPWTLHNVPLDGFYRWRERNIDGGFFRITQVTPTGVALGPSQTITSFYALADGWLWAANPRTGPWHQCHGEVPK
jgi:hypothetical protein